VGAEEKEQRASLLVLVRCIALKKQPVFARRLSPETSRRSARFLRQLWLWANGV
jgi:hypothetical protein